MQGGSPQAERDVLGVRRSERRGERGTQPKAGSPQVGLHPPFGRVPGSLLGVRGPEPMLGKDQSDRPDERNDDQRDQPRIR